MSFRSPLSFVFLLFLTAFSTQAQVLKKTDYKKKGASIPAFIITRTDGSTFNSSQLKAGVPTVLFIFSPVCDHCEKIIDTLKSREAEFKNAQFVFVAEERQKTYMKDFFKRTGIQKIPLFKNMGLDASNLIYFIYQYQALPQANIYDRHGKLAHTFTTTIPLDSLKMFLR